MPKKALDAPIRDMPTERTDLVRNRRKIVAAARQLFSEQNPLDVQLDDVAALAEVSRATLFRHIGTRRDLIAMVYRERLAEAEVLADAAASIEDPWDSLEYYIRAMVQRFQTDRGLINFTLVLDPGFLTGPEWLDDLARVQSRQGELLERAHVAGVLALPLTPRDLLPLLSFALLADPEGSNTRRELCTTVLLRGLRA